MKHIIFLISIVTIALSESGNISGLVYYNYSYDLTKDALNEDTGFALQRVYLTYKKEISENLKYTFQTDINPSASPKEVYLKKAMVNWKSPIGQLTLGLQGMNIFNVTEKNWGFRFLEKSPMDYRGFSSSADLGIGYSGKLNVINYSLMITNGTGYKNTENDKYKKISTQFVYGEKKLLKNDGYNAGLVYSFESYDLDANSVKDNTVLGFFGGYASSCPIFPSNSFRIGAEFDTKIDSGTDISETIIAAYGSYKMLDNLEGLIYYNMYDPNTTLDNDGNDYIIVGINYYPTKGLIITPNVRLKNPESGDGTTHVMLNFQFKN